MTNLKRIVTENYDCWKHVDEPPCGVRDYRLIDGKLFTSDDYKWILLDNFGEPILTDVGYCDGDLGVTGASDEEVLDYIEYLLKNAPADGNVESANEEDTERICRLLGEDMETD